jgi:hypothetical protein
MATAAQLQALPTIKAHDLWRIGDAGVLLAYACVVLWTLQYHEKWADEAQAWLIARDLDLRTIWFHELRYEGSPGLWHTILWVAQHVFHAGYGALGYIGAVFAIAGTGVLVFLAPFPRYIRWPLAFTYVMVYQYAVIARPYTLFPLLAFLAAYCFKGTDHPLQMTVILTLMALLTAHGTILAGCLGLAYLINAALLWTRVERTLRQTYRVCSLAMVSVFAFVFAIVKPSPDVEEVVLKKQLAQASKDVLANFPTLGQKVIAVVSGAFIDYFIPSVILLVLFAAWCVWRRQWLTFVLPVGALLAFYALVHGAAHHHGTVFIAAVSGLWIAWPLPREVEEFQATERNVLLAMNGLLLALCFFNIWDSAVIITREYKFPYCGGADAAQYLKSVGADRSPMFGFLFGVVALQAYFDHNIFENNPHAYFHHGLPLETASLNVDELNREKPEYIVAYSNDPQAMVKIGVPELTSRGYDLVHFSDGYYLYKRGVFEREVYFIFKRSQIADNWPSGPEPKDRQTLFNGQPLEMSEETR